jgi:hypothetical protein
MSLAIEWQTLNHKRGTRFTPENKQIRDVEADVLPSSRRVEVVGHGALALSFATEMMPRAFKADSTNKWIRVGMLGQLTRALPPLLACSSTSQAAPSATKMPSISKAPAAISFEPSPWRWRSRRKP